MTQVTYSLVDVFTDRAFGGNQLAVFTDARAIDEKLMQPLANELNLAETTFVLPPEKGGDHRIRIFTPAHELPFAGHPIVGTAFVLANGTDGDLSLETGVGVIRVTLSGGFVQMEQRLPVFAPAATTRDRLAEALSVDIDEVRTDLPLEVGSAGVEFLFAPLRDLAAVRRARHRPGVLPDNIYLFAMGGERPGSHVHGRMFGPAVGIAEDAASGSANGPLGAYLVRHGLAAPGPLRSEQGFELGRPSILEIEIGGTRDRIASVRVGGRCVAMGSGRFEL